MNGKAITLREKKIEKYFKTLRNYSVPQQQGQFQFKLILVFSQTLAVKTLLESLKNEFVNAYLFLQLLLR